MWNGRKAKDEIVSKETEGERDTTFLAADLEMHPSPTRAQCRSSGASIVRTSERPQKAPLLICTIWEMIDQASEL